MKLHVAFVILYTYYVDTICLDLGDVHVSITAGLRNQDASNPLVVHRKTPKAKYLNA